MKKTLVFLILALVTISGCTGSRAPDCTDEQGCILFLSNRYRGQVQIFLMRPDGSGLTRLGPNSGNVQRPVWSPDGEHIAFSWQPDTSDGFWHVYVMDADGSNITRLTDETSSEFDTDWSWDGRYIAFLSENQGVDELCIAFLGQEKVQCLINAQILGDPESCCLGSPAWSPDGSRIAVSAYENSSTTELYLVSTECLDVSGECQPDVVRLTYNDMYDEEPAWSPDGRRIAFSQKSTIDGKESVCVMDAGGLNVTCLTGSNTSDSYPAWSPDGRRIVFLSIGWTGDAFLGADHLFVMNADGSGATRVTEPGKVRVRDESSIFGYDVLAYAYWESDWVGKASP